MKYFTLLRNISILIIFVSCQTHENKETPTYTVKHSDFEDYLIIDGTVEPVQTISIGCPREADGIITFIIDDGSYVNEGDVVCIIEDKEVQ